MNVPLMGYFDLAIGAVLIVMNAGLSLLFNLGIARDLLVAGARVVVQLLLVGLVLSLVEHNIIMSWNCRGLGNHSAV